ncbi:MAG: diguanylate cyclase [Lachnospiraceae bacterium]|nr:diguanylate cyclase [Lachnospiraceae bacterium]
MKKNPFKWLVIFILIVVVGLSVLAYIFLGMDREEDEKTNYLLAEMIDSTVMSVLSEPITVSRMISQDQNLRKMLEEEGDYSEEQMIAMMREYLTNIQKKFNFESVYVVSDKSKKYYSYVGLNKVIDPENDSFDSWYTIFLNGGRTYELESSTDQVNRDKLTIFVDGRVEDSAGNLLGVSGVGVETERILSVLSKYEEENGVRIDYVTSDGLVQMSSRTDAVHSSYVSGVKLPETSNSDFDYQTHGIDGFAMAKYIDELGWYLVIRSENDAGVNIYNYKFLFAELFILIGAILTLVVASKGMVTETPRRQAGSSNVDSLTGLTNRDYFIRVYGEKGTLKTTQYKSVAEFGIDDYDSIDGTLRGDRIILSIVRTAREIFGKDCQITRWNKSSFVVLIDLSIDEAEEVCRRFCKAIENIGEVTVSVGLSAIDLNDTLKNNYYRAVRNMYLVKELGGNNVKRG